MKEITFFFFSLFFTLIFSQSWVQQQELLSSEGTSKDEFGTSVSVYGNYAIIGASGKTIGSNTNQGAAYIFYFNGNSWTQQQELISNNGVANDKFGSSVSIYGSYTIIGAPYKQIGNNTHQGAAYIFYFNGNLWIQQQELISSDGAGKEFGRSVSIYEKYTIVGVPYETVRNNAYQGSAYIFYFNGTLWNQQQELISSDGAAGDYFGYSVSIYGKYTIIGAYFKTIGSNTNQGSAYIFYFNGTSWIQQKELISSDGAAGDKFGWSVSIYGNYAIIGAYDKTIGVTKQGAAYIFYFNGTSWIQQQELISGESAYNDKFGYSVSIYGNYTIIGAPFEEIGGNKEQGTVYVFLLSENSWIEYEELISNNGASGDNFGYSVSIYGNYTIIGTPYKTIGGNSTQGAVYYYYFNESVPNIQTTSMSISISSNHISTVGAIIGSILGFCLIIVLIIILIIIYKKIKKNKNKPSYELKELKETNENIENIEKSKENNNLDEELEIIGEIGRGKFGEVFKGKLGHFFVACKKLKNEDAIEIKNEVKLLSRLKHANIVTFIELKKLNNETYIVMEYMNSGDLLNYLRINEKTLEETNLFNYSLQIACGMKYLEENNIIHRDLAARNILCSVDANNLICKISDFGLSKILDNYYYEQTETSKPNTIPIKWSAPEVVFKNKISTKSDVFSFGVVLFEIFSKGREPWVGKKNDEVIEALENKERMKLPNDFGPQSIIDIINECWKQDPHERPTFKDLYGNLNTMVIKPNLSVNKDSVDYI